jgi:hypothetical protein
VNNLGKLLDEGAADSYRESRLDDYDEHLDLLDLDAAETLPFPSLSFARNPEAQTKTYPFLGVRVWPRVMR